MELGFVSFKAKDENAGKKAMQNLLSHLPGEATALYLAGLDAFGEDATATTLILVAVVSLVALLLVRILVVKAHHATTIAAVVAFVIWVYAIGRGPFQALGFEMAQGMGTFLVIAYSTIVTILASAGIIKPGNT